MSAQPSQDSFSISLENQNGIDEFKTRELRVASDRPAIVGRASKKGSSRATFAASTNGYISSPVISRTHAEFGLMDDSNDQTSSPIYLKDLESMHGTFLNQQKIVPNVTYAVKSGDTVQFGASVMSRADTFTAPRYRVQLGDFKKESHPRTQSPFGRTIYVPSEDENSSEASVESEDEMDDYTPPNDFGPPPEADKDDISIIPETIPNLVPVASDPDLILRHAPESSSSPRYSPDSPDYSEAQDDYESQVSDGEDFILDPAYHPIRGSVREPSPELGTTDSVMDNQMGCYAIPIPVPMYDPSLAEHHSGKNIFSFIEQNTASACSLVDPPDNSKPLYPPKLEEAPWLETDPFATSADELAELSSLQGLNRTQIEMKYPDFSQIPLPSLHQTKNDLDRKVDSLSNPSVLLLNKGDKTKKSAISIKDLINEKDAPGVATSSKAAGKKRKADEITEEAVAEPVVSEAADNTFTVAGAEIESVGSQSSDALPLREVSKEVETSRGEPPARKRRFEYLQFAGGVLVGAIGAIAGLVTLPEDFFVRQTLGQ